MRDGANILVLSDRAAGAERMPIPSCWPARRCIIISSARGCAPRSAWWWSRASRAKCITSPAWPATGRKRSIPYLAFETLLELKDSAAAEDRRKEAIKRYIKSIGKGLLKVMSKMGISTYQSYCGAQIFDAVGLKADFVSAYFTGTATRIEGVGLDEVAEETFAASRRLRQLACVERLARRRRRIQIPRARGRPCLERQRRSPIAACRARQLLRPLPRLREGL